MELYVLNYNNYYNRKFKKLETADDYYQLLPDDNHCLYRYNFNPGDGVDTTIVINWPYEDPDYIVVADGRDIVSRWFVIDSNRIKGGQSAQYSLTLHRDVLVDKFEDIRSAPIFVEKGMLPVNSKLIYNDENMSFNQIKESETKLTDESGCPWLVGYIAHPGTGEEKQFTTQFTSDYAVAETYTSLSELGFDVNTELYIPRTQGITLNAKDTTGKYHIKTQLMFGPENTSKVVVSGAYVSTGYQSNNTANFKITDTMSVERSLKTLFDSATQADFKNAADSLNLADITHITNDIDNEMAAYNEKYIHILNPSQNIDKFYKLKYEVISESSLVSTTSTVIKNYSLYSKTVKFFKDSLWYTLPNSTVGFFYEEYDKIVKVTAEEVTQPDVVHTITLNSYAQRYHPYDAPYDIFCIPYGNIRVESKLDNTDITFTTDKVTSLSAAMALMRQYSGGKAIIDMELLPYCPVRDCLSSDSRGFILDARNWQYSYMYTGDSPTETTISGIVLYVRYSSFTFNINKKIFIPSYNVADNIAYKIANQCDLYRLSSPNYSAGFDFNIAKSNGVDGFEVDCTYRPINPYIHVNPMLKNLYGNNFSNIDDPRGLICSGDFSISYDSDNFATYELQNKNYLNVFNREMESLDLQQGIAAKQDKFNAVAGAFTGAATGAATAGMASGGNPYAAAAGAVIGGAVSAYGGAMDIKYNQQLRADARDLKGDMFEYNLGNVKALPNTLAKVSAFNINNKYFPILEYYTCTDEEKEIFANYLKYQGMTVKAVGTLDDYMSNSNDNDFFRGRVIRLPDLKDDFHMANAIANELNEGVYL